MGWDWVRSVMLAAGCWLLLDGLKMTVTMLRMESVASKMLAGLAGLEE